VTAASTRAGLLERDDALGRVADATDEVARTGCGRVLVIEGPPGIGKSRLLREVCERASAAGRRILSASGAESESSLAFGVVRQLFAPLVDESSGPRPWQGAAALARPAIDPTMKRSTDDVDLDAVMYGLLSLCVPHAGEKGLLLTVDDAQWVDAASLQWIGYLARRVSELPVLIVLTARSPEREASSRGMLLSLTAQAETLRLLPLSEQATATLLRRSLGPSLADDVCRACHVATGGNPFYLHELLAARGEALPATERAAIEMMAPTRVVRSVIARSPPWDQTPSVSRAPSRSLAPVSSCDTQRCLPISIRPMPRRSPTGSPRRASCVTSDLRGSSIRSSRRRCWSSCPRAHARCCITAPRASSTHAGPTSPRSA
jgi:hypothetical protein